MFSILFAAIAAVFNSLMDSVENEHINATIFYPDNTGADRKVWGFSVNKFWDKRQSWNTAKKIFGWRFNAWHIAKSFMIASISLAIVFAFNHHLFALWWINFLLFGAVWIIVFNVFYNIIFKKGTP